MFCRVSAEHARANNPEKERKTHFKTMLNLNNVRAQMSANAAKIKAAENELEKLNYSRENADRIAELSAIIEKGNIVSRILHDNSRRVLLTAVLPDIKAVFSKYDGKSYGEKTKEKIRDEIVRRCNCSVYVSNEYKHSNLHIVPLNENGYNDYSFKYNDFELMPQYNPETGEYNSILTAENKINAGSIDNYTLMNCPYFCPDPEERAEKIIEKNREYNSMLKELEQMESEYNSLLPSGAERAYHTANGYRL